MKYGDKIELVTNLLEGVPSIGSISSTQSIDVTSFYYFVDSKKGELAILNSFLHSTTIGDIKKYFKEYGILKRVKECEQCPQSIDNVMTIGIVGDII